MWRIVRQKRIDSHQSNPRREQIWSKYCSERIGGDMDMRRRRKTGHDEQFDSGTLDNATLGKLWTRQITWWTKGIENKKKK